MRRKRFKFLFPSGDISKFVVLEVFLSFSSTKRGSSKPSSAHRVPCVVTRRTAQREMPATASVSREHGVRGGGKAPKLASSPSSFQPACSLLPLGAHAVLATALPLAGMSFFLRRSESWCFLHPPWRFLPPFVKSVKIFCWESYECESLKVSFNSTAVS